VWPSWAALAAGFVLRLLTVSVLSLAVLVVKHPWYCSCCRRATSNKIVLVDVMLPVLLLLLLLAGALPATRLHGTG
jgi:hypothetical protein